MVLRRSVFAFASLKLRRTLLRPKGLRGAAPRVALKGEAWWAVTVSNCRPPGCKQDATLYGATYCQGVRRTKLVFSPALCSVRTHREAPQRDNLVAPAL